MGRKFPGPEGGNLPTPREFPAQARPCTLQVCLSGKEPACPSTEPRPGDKASEKDSGMSQHMGTENVRVCLKLDPVPDEPLRKEAHLSYLLLS